MPHLLALVRLGLAADRLDVDDLLDVVSRVNEMISEDPAVEAEPIEDQPQI